jgi:hypothetical protein
MGAYMFTTTIDQMEDRAEGIKSCDPKKHGAKQHGPIVRLVNRIFGQGKTKSTRLFITWGIAMSVACVAETTAFEGIFLGGVAGIIGIDPGNAAFIGGAALFFLAIGATIPVLIVVVIGGSVSQRVRTAKTLDAVKTTGAILMIMIGLMFIILNISNLLSG